MGIPFFPSVSVRVFPLCRMSTDPPQQCSALPPAPGVISGTEIPVFGVGRGVLRVVGENPDVLVPLGSSKRAWPCQAATSSLGMHPGNFLFFSTLETEEPFFIPLGAVLYQSAFVGEFVHGKTFAPATVQIRCNW